MGFDSTGGWERGQAGGPMKLRLLLAAFLTAAALQAAENPPAFNAIMTMGREHRFVLVSDAGTASSWLKIGGNFEGYVLKGYDEKTGNLAVEGADGKVTELKLVADAATQSGGAVLPATPATLAEAESVLKTMHFDEMMAKIIEQQKKAMGPALQRMMAGMKVPPEDRARFAEMQKKIMDETMDTLAGADMQGAVARIYSQVFSKEELDSLGAFYSTPAGQAMVAKQPQVQEAMMKEMMPVMQQLGPKLQKMAQDYAAEKAAAKAAAAPAAAPAAPADTPASGKP